jgi:hypothetical protein
MRTTCGRRNVLDSDAQLFTRLEALVDRSLDACRAVRKTLAELRGSRRSGDLRQLTEAQPAGEAYSAGPASVAGAAEQSDRPPLPDERSEALAALCNRLLEELGGPEVKAAEIRFVMHKREDASPPPIDPDSDLSCGELAWELRRRIASAGDTLADVVRVLDLRSADLDESGREVLEDEVTTLDDDLDLLKAHLVGPTDWDAELECLLGGEVGPLDDLYADDENDNDD